MKESRGPFGPTGAIKPRRVGAGQARRPQSASPAERPAFRRLRDLEGVGPATMADFEVLGVQNVAQLAQQDPQRLYDRLCRIKGVRLDPCCLDVFTCAVAQARDPGLPAGLRKWWYWSRRRKAAAGARSRGNATA